MATQTISHLRKVQVLHLQMYIDRSGGLHLLGVRISGISGPSNCEPFSVIQRLNEWKQIYLDFSYSLLTCLLNNPQVQQIHHQMYQQPDYVNAESWDRMPEAIRQQIAKTATLIGSTSTPTKKHVHNPDHDGPHGAPYVMGMAVINPDIDIDKNNGPEWAQWAGRCTHITYSHCYSDNMSMVVTCQKPIGTCNLETTRLVAKVTGECLILWGWMTNLRFMYNPNNHVSTTSSSWSLVEDGNGEPPLKWARVDEDSTVSPQKQHREAAACRRKRCSGGAGRKENQKWEAVEEQEQEDLPPTNYQDLAKVKQKDLTPLNKKAKTKLLVRSYYYSQTPLLTMITESPGWQVLEALWGQEKWSMAIFKWSSLHWHGLTRAIFHPWFW